MADDALSLADQLEKRAARRRKEAAGWRKLNASVEYKAAHADALLDAAAAQALRQMAAPGWRLVPVEPTEKMIVAGCQHENLGDMAGRYAAMLAAAPSPSAPTGAPEA